MLAAIPSPATSSGALSNRGHHSKRFEKRIQVVSRDYLIVTAKQTSHLFLANCLACTLTGFQPTIRVNHRSISEAEL